MADREIKFRAWDKTGQVMIYAPSTASSYLGLAMTLDGRVYIEGDYQDLLLLQFTGLKDKNGVEIYEGDILQWSESDELDYYKVVYEVPSFKYEHLQNPEFIGGKQAFDELEEKDFEVIGNIYENQELLSDE